MKRLIIKDGYQSVLDTMTTQKAIKFVKDRFQKELSTALNLTRVSAPLFVKPETGLNDNLNGYERIVSFDLLNDKDANGKMQVVEVVQSLAKWKRYALNRYGFKAGSGLYTDMNAIRRDEETDSIHSIYVDQWDWERVINREDRNIDFLKGIVRKIYGAIKATAVATKEAYPALKGLNLPEDITFVTTQQMLDECPTMTPTEREGYFAKKYGAIFIQGIGWELSNGEPHDGRAADYDDWNLNGDIMVWNDVLGIGYELSSMGIRVDAKSLKAQSEHKHEEYKLESPYAKGVLEDTLPLTIGGGIGQSRLCMLMLEKMHIGEVQVSVWPKEDTDKLEKANIYVL